RTPQAPARPTGPRAQPSPIEAIDALAPAELDPDQAGVDQHAEVTAGRRPRAVEPPGDLARRHLAVPGLQHAQDGASLLVGQCAEDGVERLELSQSPGPGHTGRSTGR